MKKLKIEKLVFTHPWDALPEDSRVAEERIAIIRELCQKPMDQVAPILKSMPYEIAAQILDLMAFFTRNELYK